MDSGADPGLYPGLSTAGGGAAVLVAVLLAGAAGLVLNYIYWYTHCNYCHALVARQILSQHMRMACPNRPELRPRIPEARSRQAREEIAAMHPILGLRVELRDDDRPRGYILVREVFADGPSARAGLLSGDMVLSVAGTPTLNNSDFRNVVRLQTPGTNIAVTYRRGGRETETTLTVGASQYTIEQIIELRRLAASAAGGSLAGTATSAATPKAASTTRTNSKPTTLSVRK
eukprot:gnl/Spiro4/10929_TR5814_c0_g1_i1.p1 gnl/Spiro4/10929_TR5814_c0_g1~~gnl/Spiro4/10929_TR5814_c0_g1_i1.p1  ORF type:complete len:243 (+),score=61.43 gnl/Spiro4/10929_TR5814_c0_g1_i1:39-731(+)